MGIAGSKPNSVKNKKWKTPKVVLIEPNPKKRKLLSLNLNVYLACEILALSDAEEVREFFKTGDKNIDLIISTHMVHEENTILKVYYFVNSGKLKIPIILMGEELKLKGSVEQIAAHNWQKIIKSAARILNITAQDMADLEVDEYYPFPIEQFVPVLEAPVTIFERDKESEEGFRILFEKEEKVNQDYIQSLILKKVPELYVKKDVRLEFASGFSNQIIEYLKDADLSLKDRSKLTAQAHNDALNRVREIGMDSYAIEQCQAVIDSMFVMTQAKNKLSDLMDIIVNNSGSYMYRHSLLISMLSSNILEEVDWGNEEQAQKLCFVAFFHDFEIPEDDLTVIHSNAELDLVDASAEDKKRVETHALDCCELIKDFPGVPYGADTLILQHHGALNGIGFPEKLQTRLSTLAMVFMVCEDAAHFLMQNEPDKKNTKILLDQLFQKYTRAKYLDAVNALKDVFKNGL